MLDVLRRDPRQAVPVHPQQARAGMPHDDRRTHADRRTRDDRCMRDDRYLGLVARLHPGQELEDVELPVRRRGGPGLVERERAGPRAALLEEPDEALAVRVGQDVGRRAAGLVAIAGDGRGRSRPGGTSRARSWAAGSPSARASAPPPVSAARAMSTARYPGPPPLPSKPASAAIPSSSVDLPTPFSPTRMVTGRSNTTPRNSGRG